MKNQKTKSLSGLRIAIIVFIGIFIVSCAFFGLFMANQIKLKKERAVSDISSQGSKAQFIIQSTLKKLDTLNVFVQVSEGNLLHFEKTAQLVLEDEKVRNIALAPDGIMTYIYPLEGNEAALGLNLFSDENASSYEAMQSLKTKSLTISGPYELVQGGEAITGRLPIFLTDENGMEAFWGLTTLTLDMEHVWKTIHMDLLEENGYCYEFYHIDPNNDQKKVIAASSSPIRYSCVEAVLPMLNDTWYLRAHPQNGWFPASHLIAFILSLLLLDSLICLLLYLMLYVWEEWRERASKDALTGLYNHAYVNTVAKQLLENHVPKKFAYMMIDADNFKTVNDTFGHHMGDEVLLTIANTLKQYAGPSDLVFRVGGDEFSMLTSYTGESSQVISMANSICSSVKRVIQKNDKKVTISCSIGIALFPEQAVNWTDLSIFADKALYYCKRHGKSNYHLYDEDCADS